VRNEEATLIKLYERISSERPGDRSFEVIFIDDGSRDRSWDVIRIMTRCEPAKIRGLRLRRNSGNAVALSAGIRVARGGIIFTLDDDLRDGPLEIGRLLDKLDEGYDLVSSRNSGVHRLGPNCGLTCYRAEVAKKWICSQ